MIILKLRFLVVFLFLGTQIQVFAQDITTNQTLYTFSAATETQSRTAAVTLTNNSSRTAHIIGYSALSPFGKRAFRLNDSIFSIPAGSNYTFTVFFQPNQNILYQTDLVLHTDSTFGSIPIALQAQGVFSNIYYSATQNLSGSSLKTTLHNIITTGYNQLSYNTARDEMYSYIDNNSGQVSCVYTGRTATFNSRAGANANNINAEHTMPQSTFGSVSPMQTDIHHLFPCDASTNSVRSNNPFGYVNNATWSVGGSKYGNSVFEPRDFHKGSAARALLYFLLRYQDYNGFISAMESTLISWHNQFPPTAANEIRNDRVYVVQDNRNPLIDYPQFSERLGSFSGSGALANTNTWKAYPDTLWIENGIEACISIQNTGNTTVQITGTNSLAPVGLSVLNNSIGSTQSSCIRVQASTNASFPPALINIQSNTHSTLNIYVASRGTSGTPPTGSVPNPSLLSSISSGTQQLTVQVDAPSSGFGTLWNGTIVFASTTPFADFNLNNPLEASFYTGSSTFGNGSQVIANAGQVGYCIGKNTGSGNTQISLNGLNSNTTYYIYAFCYKSLIGNDEFSNGLQSGFSTDPIIIIPPVTASCKSGVFFSEYIEGSSNNKCIELYNASDSTVNLTELKIYTLFNSGSTIRDYTLSGNLAAGSTYVICNSSAASNFSQNANISLIQSIVNFNGDDLISLVNISSGDTLDRIGDPNQLNTVWSIPSNSGSTQNNTLVRADSIRFGGQAWSKARLQWHALPSNTADSLGNHSIKSCATTVIPSFPYSYTPSGDQFGSSLALGAEYAFVGAPHFSGYLSEATDDEEGGIQERMGAVFIYKKVDGNWIEWQRIQPITAKKGHRFGTSVDGNDTAFIAGAPGEGTDSVGFVYIYQRDAFDRWNLVLRSSSSISLDPNSAFGSTVVLNNTLAAASTANGIGKVQVFQKNNGQWTLNTLLQASDGFSGDGFGHSLSLATDSLLIGATESKSAYLFAEQNGSWNQLHKFLSTALSATSSFGHAVLISDGNCFIGDPDVERIYAFQKSGQQWLESVIEADDMNLGNYFGSSLDADETSIVVGAQGNSLSIGSVYRFNKVAFTQVQKISIPTIGNGVRLGYSLKIQLNEILIGAPLMPFDMNSSARSVSSGGIFFLSAPF